MRKIISTLLVFITCFSMFSCSSSSTDEPSTPTGAIELIVSTPYFPYIVKGEDKAVFTVMMGDKDITSETKIYQKPSYEIINKDSNGDYTFSSTEAGKYTFFASYGSEMSSDITIEVIDDMLDTPADAQPSKFDGFNHKVLAVQSTSLGCTYCPAMIAGIEEFEKKASSENLVIVAAHGIIDGDRMINDYSKELLSGLGITSAPMLTFNLSTTNAIQVSSVLNTPTAIGNKIESVANELTGTEPTSAISAKTNLKTDGTLQISADIKIAETAKYKVVAFILEDDIEQAGQANSYSGTDWSKNYNFDIHHNALRWSSAESSVFGSDLGGQEETQEGQKVRFYTQVSLNDLEIDNKDNIRVVVAVNKATGSSARYLNDNVVSCGINNSVSFEYK